MDAIIDRWDRRAGTTNPGKDTRDNQVHWVIDYPRIRWESALSTKQTSARGYPHLPGLFRPSNQVEGRRWATTHLDTSPSSPLTQRILCRLWPPPLLVEGKTTLV